VRYGRVIICWLVSVSRYNITEAVTVARRPLVLGVFHLE